MYLPQFRNDALAYGFLVYLMQRQKWFLQLKPESLVKNNIMRPITAICLVAIVGLAPQLAPSYNVAIPIIGIT
jgi:hypothetical protein